MDKRIILLVITLVIAITGILFKGITLGLDFTGGTLIQLKLQKPLEPQEIDTIIQVLQNRLNTYGLKEVVVKPWGKEYLLLQIAETDPAKIQTIKDILSQQGKFEAIVNGKIALTGEDIASVITETSRYGIDETVRGYKWYVPFLLTSEGAQKFAETVKGLCYDEQHCEKIYMYIDRPENAVLIIPKDIYDLESSIPVTLNKEQTSTEKISIKDIEKNSLTPIIVTDNIDNKTIEKIKSLNVTTVILPKGKYNTSILKSLDYEIKEIEYDPKTEYFIPKALNLVSIVSLTPSVTQGIPVTQPVIDGWAPTLQEAKKELQKITILLKSGKLPVSVGISSTSTISPLLGTEFVKYTILAAMIALLLVVTIVYLKYRNVKISAAIILTAVCELIIVVGIAAWIGWQLDIPSMAGIIMVIGTGVDHQIIITDEVGRRDTSLIGRIKRAFNIIMTSALTTIFAMLPLLVLGLGAIRGFALTTILGSLAGVLITRPAYAAIISKIR